ncbi:MAG: DNA polymerase III subunit gamma/tau [Bacilli bacterium]
MAYKALYRTYRPTTFKEVAGQAHIVKTLKNALACNKIAHAYLFCGPRGTGKTTMAKLLAKALNCEEGIGHQCNHCSNCISINEGSHPDVIEIDAASNNGVEDVRDIIERVKYSPIKGKYKVYIIDEVHMMSPNAFNALLKTLEEPPANVIFILATTEPHKVLPTILSRCQRYDFSKVDDKSLAERLKEILNIENVTYTEDALDLIISLSDGGVRDALSLLDQAIAYCGNKITRTDIEDIFGIVSIEEVCNLILSIYKGEIKEVLEKINYLIEHGSDIRRLTSDFLEVCKDIIIYNKIEDESFLMKTNKEQVLKLCDLISSEDANKMIDILLKAQSEFKVVNNIRSLLEVTILKLTLIRNDSKDRVTKQVEIEEIKETTSTPVQKEIETSIPSQIVIQKEEINTQENSHKEEVLTKQVVEKKQEETTPFIKEDPPKEEIIQDIKSEPSNFNPSPTPSYKQEEILPKENVQPVYKEEPVVKKEDTILKSDELPPFMKDEPRVTPPIVQPQIELIEVKQSGILNELDDETIINLMATGDKQAKTNLINNWKKLQDYLLGSEYSAFASLLRDAKPFILTKDILVVQLDFDHQVRKINVKDNQPFLQTLIQKINGYKVRVYGINRKRAVELYGRFQSLYQVGKLPKPETIHIDFKF